MVSALIGAIIGFLIAYRLVSTRLEDRDLLWSERIENLVKERIEEEEGLLRRDAAERSGRVLSGRVLERFSPLLKDFPFDPHDAVWIGNPVDFVIFDGLSKDRQDAGGLKRVVLVEVKSGSGKLSRRQRKIKDIVEGGHVEWEMYRVTT
jgi:predicted Holliday junction resolvase-like endonuclease